MKSQKACKLPKQIAFEGKTVDFCEPSRKDCTHHTPEDVWQQLLPRRSFAAISFSRFPIVLVCIVFFFFFK